MPIKLRIVVIGPFFNCYIPNMISRIGLCFQGREKEWVQEKIYSNLYLFNGGWKFTGEQKGGEEEESK